MELKKLFIILNGFDEKLVEKKGNKVIICQEDNKIIDQDCTLLQTDYYSLEDLVKAEQIINKQLSPLNEIIIINKNIDLNMISYQYDYQNIKDNYLKLANLYFFINLLIKSFNKKLDFTLSFEKYSHYKVHTNIFNESLTKYLEILKKDLKDSHLISIKILN